MTEFPGGAVRTGDGLAGHHVRGGDPGADGDEEDVPGVPAGTQPRLGERQVAQGYVPEADVG